MILSLLAAAGVVMLVAPLLIVGVLFLLTLVTPLRFVNIAFEPRDLWIGVYWDRVEEGAGQWTNLYLYATILPTLALMYVWTIYGYSFDSEVHDWDYD